MTREKKPWRRVGGEEGKSVLERTVGVKGKFRSDSAAPVVAARGGKNILDA